MSLLLSAIQQVYSMMAALHILIYDLNILAFLKVQVMV